MANNSSLIGTKRKFNEILDDESASLRLKRARTVPTEDMMVLGLVPLMTITPSPLKYAPNHELVAQTKRIISSGTKTQKLVAKECNLSQTKMSQFMNLSPRVKGWESVEAKVVAWLRKTDVIHRSSNLLDTNYSVPQSGVMALDEPKKEDLSNTTLCMQNSDPWNCLNTTSATNLPQERQMATPFHSREYTLGKYSDEVSKTSSDRSGAEISAEDLFLEPKAVQSEYGSPLDIRIPAYIEYRSRRSGIQYHGFYNDHAWDNFSIVQALDSPI